LASKVVQILSETVFGQVLHGATLGSVMPTSRPRHTITETPPVKEALDELRSATGRERIDFGELTVLGARTKLRDLRGKGAAAQAAQARLAREIREGTGDVDVRAADEVKHLRLDAPAR
jgi:hypothetical protein